MACQTVFRRPLRHLVSAVFIGAALLNHPVATPALAYDVPISAQPIEHYQGRPVGEQTGKLIWRGGLVLEGPQFFGGISGITFISPTRWIMVTDRGRFISGDLEYENGRPSGLADVEITPIRNSKGRPLPPNYSRDAESIDTIYRNGRPAAVRVSFENLTRVADFDLKNGRPGGAAREVAIPRWLSRLRTNKSLESACIAPPASPISGSTLLINEDKATESGAHSAWLLGNLDKGPVSITRNGGFSPTDCAFLPDGDLLILERGTGFLTFTMQIRRIKADDVAPGALLEGEVILTGIGSDIDNMEALGVRRAEDGSIRIVIMSDDNFNDWLRTLLLEFEVPEQPLAQ